MTQIFFVRCGKTYVLKKQIELLSNSFIIFYEWNANYHWKMRHLMLFFLNLMCKEGNFCEVYMILLISFDLKYNHLKFRYNTNNIIEKTTSWVIQRERQIPSPFFRFFLFYELSYHLKPFIISCFEYSGNSIYRITLHEQCLDKDGRSVF